MKNIVSITVASGIVGIAALAVGYYAGTARQVSTAVESPAAPAAMNQQAIENVVRNYLIQNPELMLEVQSALETKQAHAAQEQIKQVLAANRSSFSIPSMMPSLAIPTVM